MGFGPAVTCLQQPSQLTAAGTSAVLEVSLDYKEIKQPIKINKVTLQQ